METRIFGQREKAPSGFKRAFMLRMDDEQPKEENRIRVIASTDEDCDFGYYGEKLLHSDGAIDRAGAFSALLNHDVNQLIGRIVSTQVTEGKMVAELEIDPEVRASNGLPILKAVRNGYLRGVSIGYDYTRSDCTFEEDENGKRWITVNRWTLREISLTPTPADLGAGVQRSAPNWLADAVKVRSFKENDDMTFEQWLQKRGLSSADLTEAARSRLKTEFDAENTRAAANNGADELRRERDARETAERSSAANALRADLLELASSHGVKLNETRTAELVKVTALKDGSNLLLRWKAEDAKEPEGQPKRNTVVEVGEEQIDKISNQAVDAILARGGILKDQKRLDGLQGNPFAGRRAVEQVRRFAIMAGQRDAEDWSENEVAHFGLGRAKRGSRKTGSRAANVTTDLFDTYVLTNVMDQAVALGFKSFGQNVTYPKFTRTREVSDFKTVVGGALDSGNLVKTVENAPFPELDRAEFGYSTALEMWGVQANMTLQTVINDYLSEFMTQIYRAGAIAQRTFEQEVAAVLEAMTWTNNTTGSAGLGTGASPTPANLDVARKAFLDKTGPAGKKLGNVPKFLLHQPSQGVPVGIALGRIINYGGMSGSEASMKLEAIENVFLAGTATTYYLIGDPAIVDTIICLNLQGMTTPQIEEFDPGAVAARKFKIYQPFKATGVSQSISGTRYTPGMQQATV